MNGLRGFLTICCNLICHVLETFEFGYPSMKRKGCGFVLGFYCYVFFLLGHARTSLHNSNSMKGMGNLSTKGHLVILRFQVARSWYVFLKEIGGCESNDKCHDICLIKVNNEDSWKNNM